MNAALWVLIGAIVWFVFAALIGPTEKVRRDAEPDPY
jgi:hypothetical protein